MSTPSNPFQFWVSPNGNDNNPGTQISPFLTIEKAKITIREWLQSNTQSEDITVWIDEGIYRLQAPLQFTSEDSGRQGFNIIYRAMPGATPAIYGSKKVEGWQLHDSEKNIYKAKVEPQNSRQLYVNDQRAKRASTSNYPEGFMPRYEKGGIQYMTSRHNDASWRDPANWTRMNKIEAVLYTQWKMISVTLNELALKATDSRPGLITVQQPGWENCNLFKSKMTQKTSTEGLWRITKFENAYEFLSDPGEWYLNDEQGELYYIPRTGENLMSDDTNVELPILEVLINMQGTENAPVTNIQFSGLTFAYATWLSPSSGTGYVSDQSGFHITGTKNKNSYIGHVQYVTRTPGNLRFDFVRHISISNSTFCHLGAVGIDFYRACQDNNVTENIFYDISSAAFQLGEVAVQDSELSNERITTRNSFTKNNIEHVGKEFVDAAGVYVGFSEYTTIGYNTIKYVPWSGIAMGWGWGLLDPEGFAGLPEAKTWHWGDKNFHTVNRYNKIIFNTISDFMQISWDSGSIYTTGYQGTSDEDALLIEGNVAMNKNPDLGGNVFYTDGGSRYIVLRNNNSINNPIGYADFGPPPKDHNLIWDFFEFDQLTQEYIMSKFNRMKYGHDIGGCRTYGDIIYLDNTGISTDYYIVAICIYFHNGKFYPVNMKYNGNSEVPAPLE